MRIYIVWPGGSGKSTLAARLGTHYNIPVIHLDELQWKPWLVESEDYRRCQVAAVAEENWIIEGSSVSILKTMKDRVDTVIILNYPPIGNIFRILKRYLKSIFFEEKRLGWSLENIQELRFRFLYGTLRWRTRQLPRIRKNLAECALDGKVVEMHSIENVFEEIIVKIWTPIYG